MLLNFLSSSFLLTPSLHLTVLCVCLLQNAQYSIQYGDNVFGVTNALFITRAADKRLVVVVVGCLAPKKKSLWGKKPGLDPGIISVSSGPAERQGDEKENSKGALLGDLDFWGPEKMEGRAGGLGRGHASSKK